MAAFSMCAVRELSLYKEKEVSLCGRGQKNELSASLFSGAMASPNKASKERGLARF